MMVRLFILLRLLSIILLSACQEQGAYQSRATEVFPPVAIENVALFRLDQLPVAPAFFNGHRTVVVFGKAKCDQACQHRLQLVDALRNTPALTDESEQIEQDIAALIKDMEASIAEANAFIELMAF